MKRSPSNQQEPENAFGRSCKMLRKKMGLTQRALSGLLGISEQTIQQWERGAHAPSHEHLESLIVLCLQRHAFLPGREEAQAQQLWWAAGQQGAPSALTGVVVLKREVANSAEQRAKPEQVSPLAHVDWGDALDVQEFYGREAERVQLEQWVLQERWPVVCVLGMGGIGKSALAVTFMRQMAPAFKHIVYRSLRDAPPLQDLLADCLQVLSAQPLLALPGSLEQRMDLLLECFQMQRCLLVLDNLETLLQPHDTNGRFRAGYEDYASLLSRVAQTTHQSCLLFTSREMPTELKSMESELDRVRTLHLPGLEPDACEHLFEERDLVGGSQELLRLVQVYDGNPLALKIVAEVIVELFGGEIAPFLREEMVIFSNIRDLLAEQFERLSGLEQALLFWLAIVREPLSGAGLQEMLLHPVAIMHVGEALEALQRRSLIERGKSATEQATFTLHSVVLEYVTEVLVERVSEQIQHAEWEHLVSYALEQATAKEYVRQAQERLLVAPILVRLLAIYRRARGG